MPAFTARQLAQWLYEKQVSSVDEMTNISKQNRQRIESASSKRYSYRTTTEPRYAYRARWDAR